MSISKTDVINAGLLLVGAEKLFLPSDDSKGARLSTAMYEIILRETYDLPINWQFAIARSELAQLSTAPDFGYDYQYQLPSGCQRVVAVVDEDGDETEYKWRREVAVIASGSREVEYDVFLSNNEEAFIKYIRLREDPNRWPGYFTKLVYLGIAIILCEPLKQDKRKKNQLLMIWEEAYRLARAGNGMENADVSDDNVRLDLGNTDVVDAASVEIEAKRYIARIAASA